MIYTMCFLESTHATQPENDSAVINRNLRLMRLIEFKQHLVEFMFTFSVSEPLLRTWLSGLTFDAAA